jgi:streptomycin 6-kinase
MIELPADFRSGDGDDSAWRAGVPALAQKYVEQWSLQPDGAVMVGNIAVVVPVRTADDTPQSASHGWSSTLW